MEEEEITIDLRDLWDVVKKNHAFIKKVTAGALIAAGLYLVVVPPTYESTALLRIKQSKGLGSSLLESMPMGNAMASQQLLNTYAEILKSRSVVVPVIEATEEADDEGKYPLYEDYIEKRVETKPYKDTEIMQVTVNAETAESAQRANQLIVDGFLNRLTELVRGEHKATRAFIEERVVSAKAELDAAEDKLAAFKKNNKVLSPDSQIKMAAEKLSMADKLKAENQVALEAAKARNSAVSQQMRGNIASVAENETLAAYQTKLAGLEAQRIHYLDKYTGKHPKVIAVNQEIAGLRQQLGAEIQKIAAMQAPSDNAVYQGLLADKFRSEAEIAVATSNLETVRQIEASYAKDVEALSDVEKEYLALMRDGQVAREIYVMLAKRLEEAKVAEVSVSTEVQVVDSSTLPEKPVSPKKARTLFIALLLGLFSGSGFVIVRELMNRTIKTAEDVEKYLGLPVLGRVPDNRSLDQLKADENRTLWQRLRRAIWTK